MESWKSLLLSWNEKFPSTFAGFAVGELQFAYAVFQLLRNNSLFLLLVFWLPMRLLRILFLHRFHVFLLSNRKQYDTAMEDLPDRLASLSKVAVRARRQSLFWYSVSFDNRCYLCHQNCLLPLAALCVRHPADRFLFADSVVNVTEKIKVATLISRSEAVDKLLLDRDIELCDDDGYTTFYCFDWLKVDSKWIPVLSTFPIYLQAIGANSLGGALSCLLILLDASKNLIWRVYDNLFTKLTVFAKLMIFRERAWLYQLLGVFSDRWKYGDVNKKHAYILKRGSYICVRESRFKGEDEFEVVEADESANLGPNVSYYAGEVAQGLEGDADYYFVIIDGMAHFRKRKWGNSYPYIRTGCDLFVS
eukprot:c12843_g1_i1 orf=47-1132(+)